jgi:hypothetical protein
MKTVAYRKGTRWKFPETMILRIRVMSHWVVTAVFFNSFSNEEAFRNSGRSRR